MALDCTTLAWTCAGLANAPRLPPAMHLVAGGSSAMPNRDLTRSPFRR
jgi:hypothetical protein